VKHSADELQYLQWSGRAKEYLNYDLVRDEALECYRRRQFDQIYAGSDQL
jgi:hypothetical protein